MRKVSSWIYGIRMEFVPIIGQRYKWVHGVWTHGTNGSMALVIAVMGDEKRALQRSVMILGRQANL